MRSSNASLCILALVFGVCGSPENVIDLAVAEQQCGHLFDTQQVYVDQCFGIGMMVSEQHYHVLIGERLLVQAVSSLLKGLAVGLILVAVVGAVLRVVAPDHLIEQGVGDP